MGKTRDGATRFDHRASAAHLADAPTSEIAYRP
jgi:hypothetical protein